MNNDGILVGLLINALDQIDHEVDIAEERLLKMIKKKHVVRETGFLGSFKTIEGNPFLDIRKYIEQLRYAIGRQYISIDNSKHE